MAGANDEFNHCYNSVHVPTYEKAVGVIRGRRFRAVVGEPTYLTIYELGEANNCDLEGASPRRCHDRIVAREGSSREGIA